MISAVASLAFWRALGCQILDSGTSQMVLGILGARNFATKKCACGQPSFPRLTRGAFDLLYRHSGGGVSAFWGHIILYVLYEIQ